MRQMGKVLILGLLVFSGLLAPQAAAAETIAVTGNRIQITATVLPARYVIVDKTGEIKQILNNNSVREVVPQIYLNTVAAGNELPLTPKIGSAVDKILENVKIQPGVIYERPSPTVASKQFVRLSFLSLANTTFNKNLGAY